MNCYYSNLIEGHYTHPVDIERALKDEYSADPEKRDLQLEAKAHIKVQEWIDAGWLKARPRRQGGELVPGVSARGWREFAPLRKGRGSARAALCLRF